jgi:hypothetical protein
MELPPSYLKKKVTLEQVLAEKRVEDGVQDYRDDWDRLLAKMLPGDELWEFEPPQGAIRVWGIALVRHGRVISTLVDGVD